MRRLLEAGLQELIEAEVAARIGAGRYERTEERVTHRYGTPAKHLATPAGTVELAIPKLREGSFFPSLLGAAPQDRSGAVGGDRPGLDPRGGDPAGRPAGQGARQRGGDLPLPGVTDLCRDR